MSPLYVYALLRDPDGRPLGVGLGGESLWALNVGGVFAVVGAMEDLPSLEPVSLRGHDAVVRRLAAATDAILPARYGAFLADEEVLARALAPRAAELIDALALVRGREQMTLRVYGEPPPFQGPATGEGVEGLGPGARYLQSRMRAHGRERTVHEIAPLRPALGGLVRSERVERHGKAPPLLASVYHLVDRGASVAYVSAVQEAAPILGAVRVTTSGPWPPYAFAPEVLQ